jgi:hypothetical protein
LGRRAPASPAPLVVAGGCRFIVGAAPAPLDRLVELVRVESFPGTLDRGSIGRERRAMDCLRLIRDNATDQAHHRRMTFFAKRAIGMKPDGRISSGRSSFRNSR